MGINAQTSVPKFTAGDTLTAANTNLLANGIPVFSGTATRDAAFGGSDEKVLAEGQFAYLEDTNSVQYYDSAAWQPVGVAPGLVYLTGATFTSQTTVSLPTSTFSSTYRNYKIFFQTTTNGSIQTVTLRLRAAGADLTTANYQQSSVGILTNGNANNGTDSDQTSFGLFTSAVGSDNVASFVADIISPAETARTYLHGHLNFTLSGTGRPGRAVNAVYDASTAADSLSIISTATNNLTGVYRVYGYANS